MRIPVPRSALAAALLSAVCLGAAPALAAQVKQVRVGDHPSFTRIVIELDQPAAYSLAQKEVGGVAELVVDLAASSAGRVVTSSSRLVESIGLRSAGPGAVARIQLRSGPVHVKEMVLKSPHRIVLDLSLAPKSAAAPVARATPPPPVVAPAPAASKPAPAPKAAPAPAPTTTKAMPVRAPEPAPAPEAAPERRQVARSATPATVPPAGSSEAEEPEGSEPETPAEDEASAMLAAEMKAAAKKAPTVRPPSVRKPEPQPAAQEPSRKSWTARLGSGDPTMGLSIALGGVAFLLLAFLALRRRSQRAAREAASAPWPPPGAVERPEALAYGAAGEEEEEAVEAVPSGPLFAETEVAEQDDGPVVAFPQAAVDAEPEVVAKDDASPRSEELERRIERLEARLADSLDARERLERQLASHTEELRVQRAAIARTQRAVRAAVRGPEAEVGAPGQGAAQPAPQPAPGGGVPPEPGHGEG